MRVLMKRGVYCRVPSRIMEDALARYLAEHIPLSAAMDVHIEVASPARILLSAPLGPNTNHRGTAFGGSISSLAILAGWSWLWVILSERASRPELVIASSHVEFVRPITGEFAAELRPPSDEAIALFLRGLEGHGKGRIELSVEVLGAGEIAARFKGTYVALAR
ncbi:thioesterase [bacterium]|nr:MAG: thioesterase [bacterium]